MGLFFKVGGEYLVQPGVVVEADAVEAFKKLLVRHIIMPGMEGSVQVDKGWSWYHVRQTPRAKGLVLVLYYSMFYHRKQCILYSSINYWNLRILKPDH